jgi:hypothetical protein
VLHEQAARTLQPPVTAVSLEFFRGDEVRETPEVMCTCGSRELGDRHRVEIARVERAVDDECGVSSVRAQSRIDNRAGRRQFDRCGRRTRHIGNLDEIRDTRNREQSTTHRSISAEAGDAGGHLAHPLASGALGIGQIQIAAGQIRGIDEQSLRGPGPQGRAATGFLDHRSPRHCG